MAGSIPSILRRTWLQAGRPYRRLTSCLRVLPDFLIVGAQKAGTTSLYEYMLTHPALTSAYKKEIHYFDRHYDKGLGWYRSRFPSHLHQRFCGAARTERVLTGEATPNYLPHPHVPERCHKHLGSARIIVLLRNPIDRAYSGYRHQLRCGRETRSFEQAVEQQMQLSAQELDRILCDPTPTNLTHRQGVYLAYGLYLDQIRRWMQFYPKQQMLILDSAQLFADSATTVRTTFEFLGLSQHQLETFPTHNSGGEAQGMAPEIRQRLAEYYRRHNEQLFEFLGVDFGWNQ